MTFSPPIFRAQPRRILIIKPSAIGDVVHALPILNLLRRRWPEAHIAWLLAPQCAGLLQGHPQLNEIVVFDRKRLGQWWRGIGHLGEVIAFARGLRRRHFDLVIDLQGLLRSGWMAMETAAPIRVGLANARELAWAFYTHHVTAPPQPAHAIDRYLAVSEFLGCGRGPVQFIFPTDEQDRLYVAGLVPPEPYAVLMPASNWQTKRWPVERFAALVEPLRRRLGLHSVVAGAADAGESARQIPGALDLSGRTNLRQTVALLERAALVISNDTGPMHIASALGRPLVALFGPTNPARTGPYGRMDATLRLDLPCSPCYSRKCSHQSCLRWLDVEPVLQLAEKQLAQHGGGYAAGLRVGSASADRLL